MFSTAVLAVLVSTVLILIIYYKQKHACQKSPYKIPKGPAGVPIFGNILQMVFRVPHLQLLKWAQDYSDLFTIYLGARPALVITDAKLLKQLLSQYPATGKFKTEIFLVISRGPFGIVMTDGAQHSEQRKFCLKALKAFGFGNKSMANDMQEIPYTCSYIESKMKNGILCNLILYGIMKHSIANHLWTFVFGKRLEGENATKVVQLLDKFIETFQYSGKTGLCFVPWFRHVSPQLSGYEALNSACENLHSFIEKEGFIKERNSWRKGESPKHVADCYFEHLSKCIDNPSSSFNGENGVNNCLASISELFIGGVESTAATLTWLMFYLSWFPNVQRKVQEEIDRVIGEIGTPSVVDRQRMPYTEAVILETQRYSSVVPLGLIHELLDNIPDFHGFSLPKGLLILPNLYGIQHSEKVWGDPENFRPERFLESNPSIGYDWRIAESMRENMVSFQPGKRSCLGEPLAKDFMFLMVTHLFKRFRMKPDPSIQKEKYFDADVGFALIPKLLSLQIEKR